LLIYRRNNDEGNCIVMIDCTVLKVKLTVLTTKTANKTYMTFIAVT